MYNGIGLQTPRGSGTNGYVTRNLSAIRKTKEKIPEYKAKDDAAVKPYDAELIEHERRRQAEVRCMELRELLEEEGLPEEEIEAKVDAFRVKLLAEKKLSLAKDASGRTLVKDSHELSMAQESKNERAKDAFGIRNDFVPGSSFETKQKEEKPAATVSTAAAAPSTSSTKDNTAEPTSDAKSSSKHDSRSRKRKKSKKSSKRTSSSSSSSSSSSDEEAKRKKRKKDRKKKSKKSHHHRRDDDESPNDRSSSSSSGSEESHNSPIHNVESDDNGEIVAKYSVAILDIPSHGEVCANTIDLPHRSHSQSPVDIIESTLIPVLQTNSDCTSAHNTPNSRKFSQSPCSVKSRSRSGTPVPSSKRRSRQSRSPSVRSAHSSSHTHSSRSSVDRSKSPSVSSRSPSRSRSRSNSSSGSSSSASSSRSARSIPRRRGSPSFLDRRRITSARKRPIPYKRRNGLEWDVSSSSSDSA